MKNIGLALSLICTCLFLAPTVAQAQATRTWVSGVGDDANPCSRTAPCRTFPGAISKTAAGGEIDTLDPGSFGAVTIVKAITIASEGSGEAGILAAGTNGVTVNCTTDPNCVVVLRGLQIDEAWIHEIVRRQVLATGGAFTKRTFEQPEEVRNELLGLVGTFLPADQVEKHFTPSYRPWRQRIAFMPNGDLFVEGTKVVMINHEEYHLYVSGVIRPSDIQMDNSVDSSLIADARVEFTGRGDINDQVERGWLTKILDFVNPF